MFEKVYYPLFKPYYQEKEIHLHFITILNPHTDRSCIFNQTYAHSLFMLHRMSVRGFVVFHSTSPRPPLEETFFVLKQHKPSCQRSKLNEKEVFILSLLIISHLSGYVIILLYHLYLNKASDLRQIFPPSVFFTSLQKNKLIFKRIQSKNYILVTLSQQRGIKWHLLSGNHLLI